MQRSSSVEEYLEMNPQWKDELELLRELLLSCKVEETIKWGAPVYTVDGKNVVGLGAFKSYVGIWFFQGSFLTDKENKLINAQEGKTKGLRQWRFNSVKEINKRLIKAYVNEAIKNSEKGIEIKPERNKELVVPEELIKALKKNKKAGKCFEELSLSKRREYADHIESAKREETKIKRLEKIIPMIIDKVGLHDKYKNC